MAQDGAGNLVVLGAGYGGLTAALVLSRLFRKDPGRKVVLVDRNPYHTLKTRLHEAAVGRADVVIPIAGLLRRPNISFRQGEALRVDAGASKLVLKDGELSYERLVLALGSVANYYGIPGLAGNSVALQSKEDADRILESVSAACRLVATGGGEGRVRCLVGGGGLSGVEFAAEVAEKLKECGARAGGAVSGEVVVLEAGDRLVPFLEEGYSRSIQDKLVAAGVRVVTGRRLARCGPGVAVLDSGEELKADLIVWTGGIRASDLLKESGLATGEMGRVVVDSCLRVRDCPTLYAIGDNALVRDPADGRPVATSAQLALQEGRLAARNIHADLTGRPPVPYRPRVLGEVVSLGRHLAVGWLALPWKGRLGFLGFVASLLKQAISERHLFFLWRESKRW
jgi:NADH dehydrogenase